MRLIMFILFYLALSKIKLLLTPQNTQTINSTKSYLDIALNTVYQVNLSIGTPSQEFSFQIDTSTSVTSSQWLWVPKLQCTSCHASSQFDSSKSQTFQSEEKTKLITYDSKSVVGVISKDIITVSNYPIKAQSFVLASQDKNFESFPADGILGLASSDSAEYDSLIKTMESSGVIKRSTFSLFLGNEKAGETESNIIFGGHELEKHSNDDRFTFIRALYLSTWSSTLGKVQINNEVIRSTTRIAFFDSSINVIYGPYSDILGIFTKIQEKKTCVLSGFLQCKCKNLNKFPKVDFFLDSKKFSVNPEEYVIKENGTCTVLFLGIGSNAWYLGTPFLRSYYTYYDMEKKNIGLARSSSASKLKSSGSMFWTLIITILSITAFLILIIVARVYYLKRRNSRINPRGQRNLIPLVDMNN